MKEIKWTPEFIANVREFIDSGVIEEGMGPNASLSALGEIERLKDIIRRASEENAESSAMNIQVDMILAEGYEEQ